MLRYRTNPSASRVDISVVYVRREVPREKQSSQEFSLEDYITKYAVAVLTKNKIKSLDYSYVVDILGNPVEELGKKLNVDNGSIDTYVIEHQDEFRKAEETRKIYPTRSFYYKKIKPIVVQTLEELAFKKLKEEELSKGS